MTRAAPFGLNNVVFLSQATGWIIGGVRIRASSGSPATVFRLIPRREIVT